MRKSVYKSMLDADMNVRYWKYLTQRYSNRDRNIKIFLAITSSGAVAGWSIWNEIPFLWQVLSGISAIIAIVSPILNYQKIIESTSDLSGKWWELLRYYESFWLNVKNGEIDKRIEKEYTRTKAKEDALVKEETKLPQDIKLLRECQNEVLRSRGLKKKEG
ncbi:MAG: hypothetical protein ACT6FE_06955 [Methanosarcinaceae archaeon]